MPTSESPLRIASSRKLRRPVLGQGQQPEQLVRHVDGERVLVHAVQTPLGHETLGIGGATTTSSGTICSDRTRPSRASRTA